MWWILVNEGWTPSSPSPPKRGYKMKITFKKEKPLTGLAAVGSPKASTDIKVDKLVVGVIAAPSWQTKDDLWSVKLAVAKEKTEKDPAPFKWVTMKKRFASELEARAFVEQNLANIVNSSQFVLHQFPKNEF